MAGMCLTALITDPEFGKRLAEFNEANMTPTQREILAVGRAALHRYMAEANVVPYAIFRQRRSDRSRKGQL